MILIFLVIAIVLAVIGIWLDFYLGDKNKKIQETTIYPARGETITWFDDGKKFFDSFFEDISEATNHIHILFFIFRSDSIGQQLIHLLCRKASEGVEVRVLTDRLGAGLERKSRQMLIKNGVQFFYSQTPSFPYFFYSLNRRNHRKITVIDGKIGYLGGFNVGDEYLGRDPKLGYWRDFHCRFTGAGVQDLQTQFISDWRRAGASLHQKADYFPEQVPGEQIIHFLSADGAGLADIYLKAIQKADRFIYIGTPYFIPTPPLQNALHAALERGVKIYIILPEKRDHPFVQEASLYFLKPLLREGATAYHFQLGFYHVKALIVDDMFCMLGTANFDRRSLYLNNEMNVMTTDQSIIHKVKDSLETDIKQSTKLNHGNLEKTTFPAKLKEKLAVSLRSVL